MAIAARKTEQTTLVSGNMSNYIANNVSATRKPKSHQPVSTVWKVSASIEESALVHCLGYLSSVDAIAYETISFSANCLSLLRLNASDESKINMMVLIDGRAIELTAQTMQEQYLNGSVLSFRINRIPLPMGYPTKFGHYEEDINGLAFKEFIPNVGALKSMMHSMPWMIHIKSERDICNGVLIDVSDIWPYANAGETNYALTTATCAIKL
uniref:Uncharacterized protein n=1 Tax=Romanomermis culicivorax TaxID=13658 RepID=A0A915HRD5_ROMCU